MERRSRSRLAGVTSATNKKEHSPKKNQKTNQKLSKNDHPNDWQKRLNQNILLSLTNMFLVSHNETSLIYPWMKQFDQLKERIIGTNYVIVGPSQSGKYSAVKYALDEYHKDVQEILIDCDINTTERQILTCLVDQFRMIFPKSILNLQATDMIQNQNIDLSKLDPYIIKYKIKFVVVIKKGEYLVQFKKQFVLYNLFEWMASQNIQEVGGLVILSRELRLIDRFQKRVRSRFCGNKICIFRPQKGEIFIKILTKRIQEVIKDKQAWMSCLRVQKKHMQEQCSFESGSSFKQRHKSKTPSKIKQQSEGKDLVKTYEKYKEHPYIVSLNKYCQEFHQYCSVQQIHQYGIQDFFVHQISEFQKFKNKQSYKDIFSDATTLKPHEQIECLQKLKQVIQKNKQLLYFFQSSIQDNMIITIPFVLTMFQHIFMKLDESLIKYLPVNKLKKIVYKMFIKSLQIDFPKDELLTRCLQNFNNVQLLILILICKLIDRQSPSVKLTLIYKEYRSILAQEINKNSQRSSNKYPIQIIERSLDRLYRAKIIQYSPSNVWNSQIKLLFDKQKVRGGLKHVAQTRKLKDIIIEQLKQINIFPKAEKVQQLYVNMTINQQ